MTLLDDAKIITTANAGKAGTLYSIKPDSGLADLGITRATTATRVDSAGVIESVAVNEPQLDYSDGSCPSFLVEHQRTNLVSRSVDFSWFGYYYSNASVTDSSVTSPDGGTNASEITTTNSSHYMFTELTVTAGSTYTFSFYAKRGTMTDMNYAVYSWNASSYITSPTSYYSQTSSSWSRISVTFTVPSGTNTIGLRTLDDSGVTGTVFLWGVQLEIIPSGADTSPTSYIPTSGATVTRNQTVFEKTGLSSLMSSTEGVFFMEIDPKYSGTYGMISIGGGMSDTVGLGITSTSGLWFMVVFGGTYIYSAFWSSPGYTSGFNKIAIKYKSGDTAAWVNGVEIATSATTGTITTAFSKLSSGYATLNNFYNYTGSVRQLQVYDTALTDAQLLALTT